VPPRKPTHLKIMDGEKNADRINRAEPLPEPGALIPPFKLSPRAQEIWNRLAPDMKAKGVFTEWDVDAFAQACDCLAMYWTFRELLEDEVYVKFDKATGEVLSEMKYVALGAAGGVIKSPYWQMARDAQAMALQIFSRFGMTPADRSKLSVKDENGHVGGLDELIS
jgi:P27 family predicted phage terminase small subunit